MIDIEHCTILGNETVDANSLNRCMFNIHRKMVDAANSTVGSFSENIPEFPFFSGGYYNALEEIQYVHDTGAVSATDETPGVVPRLYSGKLDIYGSQDEESFSTESETGNYYYTSEQLSTFAPTVSALYNETTPLILRPIAYDDESTMVTGVSSLGTASSPTVKFTSYLVCSNMGVSFGTVTFSRNNGDRQNNVINLNMARDLIGIDGIESIDFFSIGNGFSSGVRTVSENLDMVSDICQCEVTYKSDNDITVSNITKSDNSDSIIVDSETGMIVDWDYDRNDRRYVSLSNDEVTLNFFIIFTLKNNPVKYSDDLWCFYVVDNGRFDYAKRMLSDARNWAKDYFRYGFDNFEAADDGTVLPDGTHQVDPAGCVKDASDAFNGCYNATFRSLCWISPALVYAERMFKGCTYATFDSLPSNLTFSEIRSAASMFENCMTATFGNVTTINLDSASRMSMMFAGCSNASFEILESITLGGDASKMFYGVKSSDFLSLKTIDGAANRLVSMFEGCDNASFPSLETIYSRVSDTEIDATKMFFELKKPEFSKIGKIELSPHSDEGNNVNIAGYIGVSMFEGCINASFDNLSSLGNLVDGTRMFYGCDPYFGRENKHLNKKISTFENLKSLSDKLVIGNEMFKNNAFLSMGISSGVDNLEDGRNMFENTSSVTFSSAANNLKLGNNMFASTVSATVLKDMKALTHADSMFTNSGYVTVSGDFDNVVYARYMFENSDHVELKRFPSTVEDATMSFANITGHCNIYDWRSATDDRICNNCFAKSKNIWINGDIVAGKVVSTSHMFDSASGLVIYNKDMENPVDEDEREKQFYSTGAGENFTYIQKFDENGSTATSAGFTFVGNASYKDIDLFIPATKSEEIRDSLFMTATLKTKSVEYSLFSVSPNTTTEGNTVTLYCSALDFDGGSPIISSGNYYYATVEGVNSSGYGNEIAIREIVGFLDNPSVTGYVINNTNSAFGDGRFFEIEVSKDGGRGFYFKQYENIGRKLAGDNPIYYGEAYYSTAYYLDVNGQNKKQYQNVGFSSISWDFVLLNSGNSIKPCLMFTFVNSGGGLNRVAILDNGDIEAFGESDYVNMLIANSVDRIKVDVIEVLKNEDPPPISSYGYLMQYKNYTYNDNRLIFCKMSTDILDDMMKSPKRLLGDLTVAQIFSDHDFSDDVPFKESGADSSRYTSRVKTRFSIGNADMSGKWKKADSMFHNVIEDSLLSGYFCLTDDSLENVDNMFAIDDDRVVAEDNTFRYAGYLLQNLHYSDVNTMEGMFRNRMVCEPAIFTDMYNESEGYISFQIPENVENAASAFYNCHISSDSELPPYLHFDEIGFYMPPTLTGAADMFNGYKGPKIRFGYGSDGNVYIADGIKCDRMFYGCEFTNTPSEKIGLSIPTIYLGMFEGSDFEMNNISSLEVRNGMNFANPYDSTIGPYFYNGSKILGCSSISFDSLRTDVLDWFCTDIGDVEGVYLATVIGPQNTDDRDYRLMSTLRDEGTPPFDFVPIMSKTSQFHDNMVQLLYESTNSLKMNLMTEIENKRGRMTCMFNLPILFGHSDNRLGDTLKDIVPHGMFRETYQRLTSEEYLSKTYNSMDFGLVERINAIEMPFAFAGLSSATFDSLETISPSAVMAYGAFMNCSAATFDNLTSVYFIQDGLVQPDTMTSRFTHSGNEEWYGNYCNMFAGCKNTEFGSLETIMLNSKYATFGQTNNKVLIWFDVNGDINYSTYSDFSPEYMFSFYAEPSGGNIHISVNSGNVTILNYDTLCKGSESSTVDVKFFKEEIGNNLLAKIIINPIDSEFEPHLFFIDTLGQVSTDPTNLYPAKRYNGSGWEYVSHFTNNYQMPLTGNTEGEDEIGRTYTVGATGDYGIKEPKYLVLYRNATGYHSLDVDKNYRIDINYKVVFSEANGKYSIDIYDNNQIGKIVLINSYATDIDVNSGTRFRMEMTEINYELTPIITIIDSEYNEHLYEILAGGQIERLAMHPKFGVVKSLNYETGGTPFMTNEGFIDDMDYSDNYGQSYKISTQGDESGYYLVLKRDNEVVARLGTPVNGGDNVIDPSEVYFNIGSYTSNGMNCVIVTITHLDSKPVYYKIYNDAYFDEYGKSYRYVEEVEYDPLQPLEYEKLLDIEIGKDKKLALAHRCYCSGMFMDDSSATFSKLDTIMLPSVGSCAGMFESCGNVDFSSLRQFVLPMATMSDDNRGYEDYKGVFSGIPVSSVNFGNLTQTHTNIYALGKDGGETLGYVLFSGMLDDNGNAYDDMFNTVTKNIAISKMKLSSEIADRMIWGNGLTRFNVSVRSGDTVYLVARTLQGFTNVEIHWGDGNNDIVDGLSNSSFEKLITHTYSSEGNYSIVIGDTLSRIVVGYYGDSIGDYSDTAFESATGSHVDNKVTSIESFGKRIQDLSYAFVGCESLREIPEWENSVNYVQHCYHGCRSIVSKMPKWTNAIMDCTGCYYGCSNISQLFSENVFELMPQSITKHSDCVLGSSDYAKSMFFPSWGGNGANANSNRIIVHV